MEIKWRFFKNEKYPPLDTVSFFSKYWSQHGHFPGKKMLS